MQSRVIEERDQALLRIWNDSMFIGRNYPFTNVIAFDEGANHRPLHPESVSGASGENECVIGTCSSSASVDVGDHADDVRPSHIHSIKKVGCTPACQCPWMGVKFFTSEIMNADPL
jgi:hypothetical protein